MICYFIGIKNTNYLYNKNKTQLTLSEIFADTGLDKLNWDFRTSQNLEYTDSAGRVHDFYYAVNVVTDLAALILESRKNKIIKITFGGAKMARLAGVDLPREKRIEIGLTYIYGIA